MTRDLSRLLRPRSIAVIGGGAWCRQVITQCRKIGFDGDIWPVHPKGGEVAGLPCFSKLEDLPRPPDASFIGINRFATIEAVKVLADMKAGGAVCFASGFLEAHEEDADGAALQKQLLEMAGDMPILGPNCYGFINYLDGALLWPDQHGGKRVARGVAIITQSSNIAINLTMQKRGLPIAYMVTAGNQAQLGMAEIGEVLLADERVSTLGLHIEGFGDLRGFERLSAQARALGKRVVVLKVGKSDQAQKATLSHTASLAGGDAGAQALLDRLGFARAHSIPAFLEALKMLHIVGPLSSNNIASVSCSGGEASLCADIAIGHDLVFPPLTTRQQANLRAALGPMVALANPLDYHTYIWNDAAAMTKAFSAIMEEPVALTLLIVDFPREDRCESADWESVVLAALGAARLTGHAVAMVSTLPENMPETVAERLIAGGVVPLFGLGEALAAAEIAAYGGAGAVDAHPILLPSQANNAVVLEEAAAKEMLAEFGVSIPKAKRTSSAENAAEAAEMIGFPVVLKGEGIAHKTEAGAVRVNLQSRQAVLNAANSMPCTSFLVEEMITDTVAELLIGVTCDPAHGYVLTLAAGGVLTELLEDHQSLLVPATKIEILAALAKLKLAKLLGGYRGGPVADKSAIVETVEAVQQFVQAYAGRIDEIEINPLLCGVKTATVADALIKMVKDKT